MKNNQSGQAVIIILLIMVVGLTIGISVVSRSLLNVKLSSQTEESSRAFTAAEAGVEVALESGVPAGGIEGDIGDSNSKYTCKKDVQTSSNSYVFYNVEKDKAAQLYLSDPANIENKSYAGVSLRVMWGAYSSSYSPNARTPALEVNLVYETKTDKSYHVAKFALDPDPSRANSNNFDSQITTDGTDSIDTTDGTRQFQFGKTLDVASFNTDPNFLIFARFRALYNDGSPTIIGIKSLTQNTSFPSQGSIIDCLGTRDSGVSRRIKVFENYPSIPDVFDYVLFNGNKNQSLGH